MAVVVDIVVFVDAVVEIDVIVGAVDIFVDGVVVDIVVADAVL